MHGGTWTGSNATSVLGARPWLGYVNGGTVNGVTYDKKQCYLRALELDPGCAHAWITWEL